MDHQRIKNIAILGSTGSIGRQALDVIRRFPGMFRVEMLTAQSNDQLLVEQAVEFQPNAVVIGDNRHAEAVRRALAPFPVKVFCGEPSLLSLLEMDSIDIVLIAVVGFAGLKPTVKAIECNKQLALANKEALVVAGRLVMQLASEKGINLIPVDSEHSAVFQCLAGEFMNEPEKIILTASGGPFRGKSAADLVNVSPGDALKHPNWSMGPKITIDSATLMNKGLEVIEAHWLFGVEAGRIEVIIHPESVIHSMVQFRDGSVKAQMGLPDMRLPILYAFSYPYRFTADFPRFDFRDISSLNFEMPDTSKFPCLMLAYEALSMGGNVPCVLNASNEVAVSAFLKKAIRFTDIPAIIEHCMGHAGYIGDPSADDLYNTDKEARLMAENMINH